MNVIEKIKAEHASTVRGPLYHLELQQELDRCGSISFWKTWADGQCIKPIVYHCKLYRHCKRCRRYRAREISNLLQTVLHRHPGMYIKITKGITADAIRRLVGAKGIRRIPITPDWLLVIHLRTDSPLLDGEQRFLLPAMEEIEEWVSLMELNTGHRESGSLGIYEKRKKRDRTFDIIVLIPDIITSGISAGEMWQIEEEAKDEMGWPVHQGTNEEIEAQYELFFQYVKMKAMVKTPKARLQMMEQRITLCNKTDM